jgi:hypothetical protein
MGLPHCVQKLGMKFGKKVSLPVQEVQPPAAQTNRACLCYTYR